MAQRANPSGISLNEEDAAIVKGMLDRGDRQHDIAAWFGVNGGRIAEVSTGARFTEVEAAPTQLLPPSGPYLSGRDAEVLIQALTRVRQALDSAEDSIRRQARR